MPQLLSVFRAARLVGVSRSSLQRKIHDEGIETFEGKITVDDLLALFPRTTLEHDSEYDRVQYIKQHAFAKRVREHLLPDVDVLAGRVAELGRELASTRAHLAQYQTILEQITTHLRETEDAPTQKEVHGLLHWINGTLAEPPMPSDPRRDLFANDTVLRIMAAHIKIQPSNHEYWLEGNDSILEAGVHSGLALNYGCTSGNCGLCKARVISGEVKKIQHHDYVLSEAEKNMNYVLMCSCTAVSDVVLEALEASGENDIPTQEVITKVKSIDQPTDDMLIMHVQTPRMQRLRFLAGQSVTLSLKDKSSGDFSVASCPCDDRNLLFHIPNKPDNSFAQALRENTKKGDDVTVVGPHGHFLFNEESRRPQIYLAYGAGFAPIKSLIEHAMALEIPASMDLFWAVEKEQDLYINNLCRAWHDALEDFDYHPIVNQNAVKRLLEHQPELEKVDIYIAGPKAAVEHAGEQLLAAGLPNEQLIATTTQD
ncbi:MAG: 2Fe-2S iron-sulfur cluster binding domain-containing protein [Ectothiorhodospiraceae bacterium]|nr:2Fe-2S iron-sulfur cluster binding domain-containing protein [Ectothiorhodospiraceae bacterium]